MARRCGTDDNPRRLYPIGVVVVNRATNAAVMCTTVPAFTYRQLYEAVERKIMRFYHKAGFYVHFSAGNDLFENRDVYRTLVGSITQYKDESPNKAIAELYAVDYMSAREVVARCDAEKQVEEFEVNIIRDAMRCETVQIHDTYYNTQCHIARGLERRLSREWARVNYDVGKNSKVEMLEAKIAQHEREKPCCPKSES